MVESALEGGTVVCSVKRSTRSVIQVITPVYGSMRYLYMHKVMGSQSVVGKETASHDCC